jgi:hypothetical protein
MIAIEFDVSAFAALAEEFAHARPPSSRFSRTRRRAFYNPSPALPTWPVFCASLIANQRVHIRKLLDNLTFLHWLDYRVRQVSED